MKRVGAALLVALMPAVGMTKPLHFYGRFVYSDLCWEKETGDAGGSRLELTRTPRGDHLTYEYGNGPLEGGRISSFSVQGGKLQADGSSSDGHFSLSVTFGARKATLLRVFDFQKDQPPEKDVMKRIKRFDQKIPAC